MMVSAPPCTAPWGFISSSLSANSGPSWKLSVTEGRSPSPGTEPPCIPMSEARGTSVSGPSGSDARRLYWSAVAPELGPTPWNHPVA